MCNRISIIIPVYNAERYLRECVDSVVNQSYDNFELILVDDGSSDESGAICDAYSFSDKRVKVIHKVNGGVSSARNMGIEEATGDYIVFVDSDDTIDQDAIGEMFYDLDKYNNPDCICYGIRFSDDCGNVIRECVIPCACVADNSEIRGVYQEIDRAYGFSSVYAKLYKASIIAKYSIKFETEYSILEDGMFVSDYLSKCCSIVFSNSIHYNYRQYDSCSLMKKFNENADFALVDMVKKDEWLRELLSDEEINWYYKKRFNNLHSFCTQIYSRSTLSNIRKYKLLKRYVKHSESRDIIKRVRIISLGVSDAVFCLLARCKMVLLLHWMLLIKRKVVSHFHG